MRHRTWLVSSANSAAEPLARLATRNFNAPARFQLHTLFPAPLAGQKTHTLPFKANRVAYVPNPDSNLSPTTETLTDEEPRLGGATNKKGATVASATLGIGALHFIRTILGFAVSPIIAHNLGTSWQGDVYEVATDIVMRFWLIFEKVINPAFLPNFIAALKEEGEERAWQFCSTAVWIISALLLAASAIGWTFMPQLVGFLSQSPQPGQVELTIKVARVLMFALFFLGFSSLTYTILNGYKRFVYAALGDAIWKLGVFAGALAAYFLYGKRLDALVSLANPTAAQEAQVVELAIQSLWLIVGGFMIGAVGKLAPHVFAIGTKWRLLRPKINMADPLVKMMFLLAVPLILGIFVSEARGLYMSRLADDPSIDIEGSRIALKYARRIGDSLIQIFPYALSIGIFPFLANLAREKDRQPLTDTLMGALRVCFFVFVPITAILLAVRGPLLRAVWEGGRLSEADTLAFTPAFVVLTLGLVGFACEMMLNQTFYAMTRAWTPTVIGLVTSVLWVVLAKYGVEGLGWGLAAIAGAEAISKSVKCIVMWIWLRPHLGEVKVRDNLIFLAKITVSAILAALVAWVLVERLQPADDAARFKIKMLLAVAASGSGAMVIFALLSSLLRVDEMKFVGQAWDKISGKLRR